MAVYRARSAQTYLAAAEAELHAHRLDSASGRCTACGGFAPCEQANQAFLRLARYSATTPLDWSDTAAVTPQQSWRQAPLMTLLALRRTRSASRPGTDHGQPGAARRRPY